MSFFRASCYKVKTGRWAGVVAAFITMSDAKDEIDWEFPGMSPGFTAYAHWVCLCTCGR